MAQRSIEETFQAIKPRGRRGIPDAPVIGASVTSSGGDLSTSLSQAGQQIAQLQAAYQQQAALITANTQAIQGNTSAKGGNSVASSIGSVASGLFGGALGLLSPLISGIAGLFGGSSTPAPLPVYTPPSPIAIDASLRAVAPSNSQNGSGSNLAGLSSGGSSQTAALPIYVPSSPSSLQGTPAVTPSSPSGGSGLTAAGQSSSGPSQADPVTQVTVNVSAMDSQSFMDRSADIASAVREAMLNLHPINDVVANL